MFQDTNKLNLTDCAECGRKWLSDLFDLPHLDAFRPKPDVDGPTVTSFQSIKYTRDTLSISLSMSAAHPPLSLGICTLLGVCTVLCISAHLLLSKFRQSLCIG